MAKNEVLKDEAVEEVKLNDCTRCKVQPEGYRKDDDFSFKCPSCGKSAPTIEEWNKLNS